MRQNVFKIVEDRGRFFVFDWEGGIAKVCDTRDEADDWIENEIEHLRMLGDID